MCINRLRIFSAWPLLLALILLSSCSKKYRIEGSSSVTSLDGKMLYLRAFVGDDWATVDSAEVVHGLFSMSGSADSARMVTLYLDGEGLMPLVLEDGRIDVRIANNELKAEGTELNDRLYDFIARRNGYEEKLVELDSREARLVMDGVDADEAHAQCLAEAETVGKEMNDYILGFIKDNFDNPLGPGIFLMTVSTMPYPVMSPRVEDLMRTAPSSFKAHPLVREFLTKAKENMKLLEEHERMQENARLKQNAPR